MRCNADCAMNPLSKSSWISVRAFKLMTITDTPPAVTGSSATNRTKTAMLSTGLEIQVPEYLAPGETIKINTVTAKFMSRA